MERFSFFAFFAFFRGNLIYSSTPISGHATTGLAPGERVIVNDVQKKQEHLGRPTWSESWAKRSFRSIRALSLVFAPFVVRV